jgi:hypothetical protein
MKRMDTAVQSSKVNGFFAQCRSCLQKKLDSRGESWRENIRKACSSERKKEVAIENSIKRMEHKKLNNVDRFWDFNGLDIQNTRGSDSVDAKCMCCGDVTTKPLKKYIESAKNDKSGCLSCFTSKPRDKKLKISEEIADETINTDALGIKIKLRKKEI